MALRLHVVDRHTEVERLVRTAEFNGNLEIDRKPVLLYSSQVFGSGKTMFGINATLLLNDTVIKQALLHPSLNATDVYQDLIDMRKSQTFTQDMVDSYTNTKTVYVDLGLGLEKSPVRAEKRTTFHEALYHAIYCAATNGHITIQQLDSEIGSYSPTSLIDLLVRKTKHTGKWFFFIDEIGSMETLESDYDDIKPRSVDAYTRLFGILRPFLKRKDTFAFCAGKSAHLTAKSLEESTSPVLLRLMAMSPLLPQHIAEVLHKTKHQGKLLYHALGLSDDNAVLVLAGILYHYTGGIPRLVLAALESLLSAAPIPPTKGEIEKVMNEKVRSDIVVDTSSFFRPEHMDGDATRVYATLLLMGVLGVKIKKSWVIRMGSDVGTKFVLDWVSNLCLHISPDGPDTYRLVFSQYLIDWLQRFPPDNDRRIVLLAGLLDQLRDLPCLIDQGRILEVMIAQSLAIRLALAETFGEIPGLQGTLLQDVVVPRDLGGRFNIQFLPSFQPGTTSGTPNIVGERIKSYNPDDWDLFFQNLSKDNWNTVGIAREKNSNGPDLVLPFQVTELADTTLPSLFYCVGTASKNMQANAATNWGDIQEEINKGLTKPLGNKQLKGKLKMVLVIASTHLMKQIEDEISPQPCGVYGAGTWYYCESTQKLKKKDRPLKGFSEKFKVPEDGQLVILSKSGMAMLLGEQALASLANYYAREEEERYTNLVLLEHSFGTLARPITHTTSSHKRKRDENDEDDDSFNALVAHKPTERTLKVMYVEDGSRKEICGPGMASVPLGTTLNNAKAIISGEFSEQNASRQGYSVIGIEWEGVPLQRDSQLDKVQHRDTVLVVMQGDVINNK